MMKNFIKYEDEHVLVAYKKARLLSQKDKTGDKSIIEFVKEYLESKDENTTELTLLNRLDRPSSGLVIFTKTKRSTKLFSRILRNKKIRKKYLAIVCGKLKEQKGLIKGFIKKLNDSSVEFSKEKKDSNKESILEYEVLKEGKALSLLSINLITGRKHQIRASMKFLGSPILGDGRYGSTVKFLKGEIALLNYYLSFSHPLKNGKIIEVKLDIPKSWLEIL
jgi:23S rRNA pseudouridine1911/1915/1917 synthase